MIRNIKNIMGLYTVSVAVCILSATAIFFASCENPVEPIVDQTLRITLSADTVWLTQNQLEENAVTIKWTSGTNQGTGSAIRYTLFVTIGDTTAAWEQKMDGIRLLTLTHDQLNDSVHKILVGRENLLANEYIDLTLQMQAEVVMTGEIQTSPAVPLVVSTFTKNILYLVGTSAVNGWDKDHPTRVMSDADDADVYRWLGTLKKGEFKLLVSQKDWLPCYVHDSNDATKMVLRTRDDEPDNTWIIKYTGNYKIECNTRDMTIAITALTPAPDYGPEMYIIGDAVRYGWDRSRVPIMAYEEKDGDTIFTWTGNLKFGNFKFMPQTDDWDPCYVRDWKNSRHLVYRPKEGDKPEDMKWFIPHDGEYTITVRMSDRSLRIEQDGQEIGDPVFYQVWMVGDATPGGWNLDYLTDMNRDGDWNIFTWTGELKAGELKFLTERRDWGSKMIYAPMPDCAPSENGTYESRYGTDQTDFKWRITDPGTYRISINANSQTISFKKL